MSGENEKEGNETSTDSSKVRDGVYVVSFRQDEDTLFSVSLTSFSIPDEGDKIRLNMIHGDNVIDDDAETLENFGEHIVKDINKTYTKFEIEENEGLMMLIAIEVEPVESGE